MIQLLIDQQLEETGNNLNNKEEVVARIVNMIQKDIKQT